MKDRSTKAGDEDEEGRRKGVERQDAHLTMEEEQEEIRRVQAALLEHLTQSLLTLTAISEEVPEGD